MLLDLGDVGTHDIQRLLERSHAGDEPITGPQLGAFIEHPYGPILPPQCIEARRVPEGLTGRAHLITRASGADDMILDPETNEPILLGSSGDRHVAVRDGSFIDIASVERVCSGRILGITRSGDIVSGFITRLHHSMDAGLEERHLFIGNQEESGRILGASVLSDGSVAKAIVVDGGVKIYRDDRFLESRPFAEYRDFFLEERGDQDRLWFLVRGRGIKDWQMWHFAHVGRDEPVGRGVPIGNVQSIVSTHRGVRFFRNNGGMYVWDEEKDVFVPGELSYPLPSEYRDYYHELDSGILSYVGAPRRERDKFTCWVLASGSAKREFVRQTSFEQVTNLFKRKGILCYWGLLDGFLYLMELPDSLSEK